jgi:glycosyltransferase involved in cell wall biosynthesis
MRTNSSEPSTPGVTVVVPAHNEEEGITSTIQEILDTMHAADHAFEVVVVDDGSTDATARLAREAGAKVVELPQNLGYGAALKAGIARAEYETIVITDADGTYPGNAIPELLAFAHQYDMVVGARVGADVHIPAVRKPAKWVLTRLASYLAGRSIPDLNSGLRVVRRSLVERFAHLLPSGFSFTTTITLAALSTDTLVFYHPIDYRQRVGTSKIRPFHAFEFLMLILRTVVFFNPLKVFLPLGGVLFLIGLSKLVWDLFIGDFSDTVVMGFLGAIMVWSVGLLSDQIARVALGGRTR